jgi:hypothetical protein
VAQSFSASHGEKTAETSLTSGGPHIFGGPGGKNRQKWLNIRRPMAYFSAAQISHQKTLNLASTLPEQTETFWGWKYLFW